MYRQGDVLIIAVKEIPKDAVSIKSEDNITTVMLGEATGHHHSFYEPVEFTEQQKTGRRFLKLVHPVALRHQEHAPIEVKPGKYEVIRQKEFDDMGWRKVLD